MIDLELYRGRIGNYVPRCSSKVNGKSKVRDSADFSYLLKSDSSAFPGVVIFYIMFTYLAAVLLGMTCDLQKGDSNIYHLNFTLVPNHVYQFSCIAYVKHFYMILISFIIRLRYKIYLQTSSKSVSKNISNGNYLYLTLGEYYRSGRTTR